MGWSSRSGEARTSLTNPIAFKVCDRCARWRNATDLVWQYEWAGNMLTNLRLLVCRDHCYDTPQEQQRNLVLPPDPIPTKDPRLEPFQYDANPSLVTNWNQPGANWNQPVNQQGVPIASWNNVNQRGGSEVPD